MTADPHARHLIPRVEDAARTYRALAQLPAPYGHGSHCRWCWRIGMDVEAAALALDLARSVGRRWSAPTWLEEVAYA